MIRKRGIRVTPLSVLKLREIATSVRDKLGLRDYKYVPVVELLEFVLPRFNITYDICEQSELGEDFGRSFPDKGLIQLRQDVYERACDNNGFARFTIVHEIGHMVLHSGVPLRRTDGPKDWKIYCDSEWQADTFTSEFMMPVPHVQACPVPSVMEVTFGVSGKAAQVRVEKLNKEKLLPI